MTNPRVLLFLCLSIPATVWAADLSCSTKAASTAQSAEMTRMAKISAEEAKKIALGEVKRAGATIAKGGLEVEDGCLVYSYDIKVPGRSGVEEVIVDAGTGKVLKTEHESPAKEAAEKAAEKVKK